MTTPLSKHFRVIPLGGLDQFGMNCCLLEFGDSLVMVDCGLAFPDESTPGVDSILPDWQWLMQDENFDRLEAVIITHGHEDHLGGLPYFLQEADVPVYTGRLTAHMLRGKLDGTHLADEVEIIEVEAGEVIAFSEFEVEFVHVNHSIPNAFALAFKTGLGYVIFTGDWKLDQTPLYEEPMNLQRFAELGKEGVFALLGDSTNALTSTPLSRSEREVRGNLNAILEHAKGRIIIALFSSNLLRIRSVIELAKTLGRKVALLGRSLERNVGFAIESGFFPSVDPSMIIDVRDIEKTPDEELIVLMTGTQAEPRASLPRYAFGNHRLIKAHDNDLVILSSRIIPGNEADIYKMLNQLSKEDINVITGHDAPIHASGHARPEELKLLITLTQPKYLIPMHGDYRIRKKHAELGAAIGATPVMINDGDNLVFEGDSYYIDHPVPYGKVAVDGKVQNEVSETNWRDRIKLSQAGIVVAYMVISKENGAIVSRPELLQKGILTSELNKEFITQAAEEAFQEVNAVSPSARLDRAGISETLRLAVRRFFVKELSIKPVVIPVIQIV